MRFPKNLVASAVALTLLPVAMPSEAAMRPDMTFAVAQFASGEGSQKHLRSAALALMIGDERFAGAESMLCLYYGRSEIAKKNKGYFNVAVTLVTAEGTEEIASFEKVHIFDNYGFDCICIVRELKVGDVVLLRWVFRKMPRIPSGLLVAIDATLYPRADDW